MTGPDCARRPLGNAEAANVSVRVRAAEVVSLNMRFCSLKFEVSLMRRVDQLNSTVTNFEFERIDVLNKVQEMKALKVCHQLGVRGVGEEQHQPKCLHKESISKDTDPTTGIAPADPPTYF